MNLKEYNFGDDSLMNEEVRNSNAIIFSVLAYFSLLWLPGLLIAPEKNFQFTKAHVNNGIILSIIDAISLIIAFIPFVGRIFLVIFIIVLIIVRVLGIFQASFGKTFNIPYLDKFTIVK